MKTVSVVICVKNEEKNIRRCIDSVLSFADEVLIVDTGSTDSTVNICQSFPEKVRVLETPWQGFSKTKNWANQNAISDYILSLDADEEVTTELQNEISQLKNDLNGVYEFNRLTNYCGYWVRHSEWHPDWCQRLFPREKAQWDGQEVHEKLNFDSSLPLKKLEGLVHHFSYYNLSEHIQRIDSYSELGSRVVLSKGKNHLLVRAVLNGSFRIFRIFFLKQGFRDGVAGLLIAVISGFAVFLKYAKAWEKQRSQKTDPGAKSHPR